MKRFTLSTILFLAMSMLIVSCSKEEDDDDNNNNTVNPCPVDDWLGTYTGTETIDGGTPTTVEFTIDKFTTADNDFQIVTLGLTVAGFEPTSCTVIKEFDNPFGRDVHTVEKDGNEVTWTRQEYDSNDVLEETTVRVGTK